MEKRVIIVGAGIAGLSCALSLAAKNFKIILVSNQASERSGSCMAEGGINASLDSYGEGDSVEKHFEDTKSNALKVADEEGIRNLTQAAPQIVKELWKLGVSFNQREDGQLDLRYFGGQKYRRTVYAGDSTGKQIMTVLIDQVRKYEKSGVIKRMEHHSFQKLLINDGKAVGCLVKDLFIGENIEIKAPAIVMAVGGYHGIFQNTTGAKADNGEAVATLFYQGISMSNLEFIQFHPTTVSNGTKRMLITEAARGEGARLCTLLNDRPYYFMEEKYPELGNRMPRDITAREIASQDSQTYLDMTGMDETIFENKLKGLREDCHLYLGLDPIENLIPISPGIHYFMGGISVDAGHRTSISGLYAAGECAACYHGANRLGGNSLLGAVYGGKKASETIIQDYQVLSSNTDTIKADSNLIVCENLKEKSEIAAILKKSMGILRNEKELIVAIEQLENYAGPTAMFAKAMLASALNRKESRGAHYRTDYRQMSSEFDGETRAVFDGKEIKIEIHHFH